MRRLASIHDVPSDFTPLGSGFYRHAHAIWALRQAEDAEGGWVLTRLREEKAPPATLEKAASAVTKEAEADIVLCPSCTPVGRIATMIRRGQVSQVVILKIDESGKVNVIDTSDGHEEEINPDEQEEVIFDLESDEGPSLFDDQPSFFEVGPMDDTTSPQIECDCNAGCECPCHRHECDSDDEEAEVEEEEEEEEEEDTFQSKEARSLIRRAFILRAVDQFSSLGRPVKSTKLFTPQLMGPSHIVEIGKEYEVEGSHLADPHTDKMYGVPNPSLAHPSARKGPEWALNDRVRLRDTETGEVIFVTPKELDKFFTDLPWTEREPMDMPGDPVEHGPDDTVISPTFVEPSPSQFEKTNPGRPSGRAASLDVVTGTSKIAAMTERALRRGEARKWVTTPEDWYPCYDGKRVRVSVLHLPPFDGRLDGWRCCVWGADDFGMEQDWFGKDARKKATTAFADITDGITKSMLAQQGFQRA